MLYVLILFYFSNGSPSVAMHDFGNQAACEQALTAAKSVRLAGLPSINGVCVARGS